MEKFYIITYDLSKDSDIRSSVDSFFTNDNSVKLSETSFLVYSQYEIINDYFKNTTITSENTFCVLEVSDPILIKLTNISDNSEIQKFIDTHKPKFTKISPYDSLLPLRS